MVRGELLFKKGNAYDSARLPPVSPALSDPATSTDEFLVTGRVPVIGKIVASERVVGRQCAEAVAFQWRQSGLETDITQPRLRTGK